MKYMEIEWKEPEELESLALKIIEKHQPTALEKPQAINILDFMFSACEKFGYEFKVWPLPKIGTQKAVGCVDNKNKKVFLDLTVACNANVSYSCFFVAAHELGHLVLHRKYFENNQTPYDYSDMEDGFPQNSRLEWQANRFASELLLPRKMVEVVVNSESFRLGITRNFGKIYVDGQACNYDILNSVCTAVANVFMVSKTVAQIRLKELDLIIGGVSEKSYRKIGDMF